MGFFKEQQVRLAVRLLAWRFQRMGQPIPDHANLKHQAVLIVDEAHRIARERGSNVVSIMKDLVNDIKNKPLSK